MGQLMLVIRGIKRLKTHVLLETASDPTQSLVFVGVVIEAIND